jgi:hypothetical protein
MRLGTWGGALGPSVQRREAEALTGDVPEIRHGQIEAYGVVAQLSCYETDRPAASERIENN